MNTHRLPQQANSSFWERSSEQVHLLIYILEFSAVGIAVILLESLFVK